MEIKKELYQKTFSRLKSSPELGKEILTMTEKTRKPKKFILRRVIVVAAVMALLFALAMGANAATGGELFGKLVWTHHSDDGSTVRVYEGRGDGDHLDYVAVEWDSPDNEDGSAETLEKAVEVQVEFDGDEQQGMKIKGYQVQEAKDGSLTSESFEVETDENGEFVYKEVEGGTSSLPEE